MPVPLTCPSCAARFALADDLRGKKAFCPKCGTPLIVTSAGVAKRNEQSPPIASHARPKRSWSALWLLPLLLLLVLLPGGLAVYLFAHGHANEPTQVVKNAAARPPQQPKDKPDTNLPPKPKDKPDTNLPPKPEDKNETKLPPEPEHKEDTPVQSKPEVIPPVTAVPAIPAEQYLGGTGMALSRDGKMLASAWGGVKLWDLETGKILRTIAFPEAPQAILFHAVKTAGVVFSPDGKTLAVFPWVFDVASGKLIATLQGAERGVMSLAFSPDGKTLLAAQGRAISTWDAASGKSLIVAPGELDSPPDAYWTFAGALHPAGKVLATAGLSNPAAPTPAIKGWDVSNGRLLWDLNKFDPQPATPLISAVTYSPVIFSPDGKTLLWGTGNEVRLFDVATGKTLSTFTAGNKGDFDTYAAAFSSDGKTAATGGAGAAEVKLWNLTDGKATVLGEQRRDPNGVYSVNSVAFTPDGKTLISQCITEIKLWDTASGKCIKTLGR